MSSSGFNKPLEQPPPPASSCARCYRDGHVHPDQTSHTPKAKGRQLKSIRFYCACGNEWTTNRAEAELHGRFLRRIDQARVEP